MNLLLKNVSRYFLALILSFGFSCFSFAQCDFQEDYSSNAGWTQVGTNVEIVNGKLHYLNGAEDGSGQRRVHAPLGTTLDSNDCWIAEFEFNPQIVGSKNSQPYSGHAILGITAGPQEPFSNCPNVPCTGLPPGIQDGIIIAYMAENPPNGDLFFRIFGRDHSAQYLTTGTNNIIAPYLDTTYYLRVIKTSPTQVNLHVFWDANRTNPLSGSPSFLTIPASITGFTTVQHGSIARGETRRKLTGYLDNLCINWSSLSLSDSLRLPNDTALCQGETLTLDIGMGNQFSYLWNTGSTDSILIVTQPGVYIATVQNACKTSTDTIVVSQVTSTPIDLPNDTTLCPGEILELNIGQGPNASYSWNTGSTDSIVNISQSGTYIATILNPCETSDTIEVFYSDPLEPQLLDTAFCQSENNRLTYTDNTATFLWNTGETSNSISPIETGWHFVAVTNNCETFVDSAFVEVDECPDCRVFLPNSFSPGNDDLNEFFGPITNCGQIEFTLRIYDRWGKQLAYIDETTGDWDGKHAGKYLPYGIYTYRFVYRIPGIIPIKREWINGTVTMLR